jgi:hypothetical protein
MTLEGKLPNDDGLEGIRERHQCFVQRLPAGEALVGIFKHNIYPMADFVPYLGEGILQPEDIHEESWLPLYEQIWERTGLLWGDLFHWAAPLNGFPWMEAILGCRVHVSRESSSVWVEEPQGYTLGDPVEFDAGNPWYRKLLQVTEALVELSAGRFPVASGIMRGISDMMAALLGSTAFYYAILDQPQELSKLAVQLAALWVEVVGGQYALIPPFMGGYVNAGIWMPGPCPVYQEDAAGLISVEDFECVIGPSARRVVQSFACPIMHLHSVGMQIADPFLLMEKRPLIEVNIDPSGPGLERLLKTFESIQAKASLELFGTAEDIEACLRALTPTGLACLVLESSLEEIDA